MQNLTNLQYTFLIKWLVVFISTSSFLILLFCFESYPFIAYHFLLLPLYFIGFWVLTKIYLIGRSEFEFPLGIQLTWMLVVILMIGFFLVDF